MAGWSLPLQGSSRIAPRHPLFAQLQICLS